MLDAQFSIQQCPEIWKTDPMKWQAFVVKEDKGNLTATCRSKYLPDRKKPRSNQNLITISWIVDNSQNVSGTKDFRSCFHSGLHCVRWQTNPARPTTRTLNSGRCGAYSHWSRPRRNLSVFAKESKEGHRVSVTNKAQIAMHLSSSLPQSTATALPDTLKKLVSLKPVLFPGVVDYGVCRNHCVWRFSSKKDDTESKRERKWTPSHKAAPLTALC